jgi:hypothetical protein
MDLAWNAQPASGLHGFDMVRVPDRARGGKILKKLGNFMWAPRAKTAI